MPHKPEHRKDALVKRLNRIEGQIGGVRRMIEEEKPFDEVIIQLNAIKSATQRISQILLEAHTDHTFHNATQFGMDAETELESLRRAVTQYSKML
jgi:DNA-binding FrmR family transcriptional regulator